MFLCPVWRSQKTPLRRHQAPDSVSRHLVHLRHPNPSSSANSVEQQNMCSSCLVVHGSFYSLTFSAGSSLVGASWFWQLALTWLRLRSTCSHETVSAVVPGLIVDCPTIHQPCLNCQSCPAFPSFQAHALPSPVPCSSLTHRPLYPRIQQTPAGSAYLEYVDTCGIEDLFGGRNGDGEVSVFCQAGDEEHEATGFDLHFGKVCTASGNVGVFSAVRY